MRNLQYEIQKAIKNKFFIIACIIGAMLAIIHVCFAVSDYNDNMQTFIGAENKVGMQQNLFLPLFSPFTYWLCGSQQNNISKIIFMTIPFLAVIPYSWSLSNNIKKNIVNRQIKVSSLWKANFIATFISSGLVIAVTLIMNFLVMLMFIPTYNPDSAYDIYFRMFSNTFMGNLFYKFPYLSVVFFILLNFIFGGLIGCLGNAVATLFNKPIMALITPAIILYAVEFGKKYLVKDEEIEISPLSILNSYETTNNCFKIMFIEFIIMFLLSYVISGVMCEKRIKEY